MKIKEVLQKLKLGNKIFEEDYLDDDMDEELEEEEELSRKDKRALKKFNKKVIAAMVAAAILISAIVGGVKMKEVLAKNDAPQEPVTVTATKQDIQKTITATGSIISAQEETAFATTSGSYPISEVYVKVGDVVKKGDPLYKLDMTTMQETLKYQQEALSLQNQQNAISSGAEERALQKSKDDGAKKIIDANNDLAEAKRSQTAAERARKDADNSLGDARRAESSAQDKVNAANNTLNAANSKVSELQNKLNEAKNMPEENENGESTEKEGIISDLESQLDAAKMAVSDAQSSVESAKKDLDSARAGIRSAESTLNNAKDTVASSARKLDDANLAAGQAQELADNSVLTEAETMKKAELQAKQSLISSQQEIAKSEQELGKATVYATMDGTVTNVNIKPGQTYSGTDAVVIDNVTDLKASADIDEAQIPYIAMGQKVQIKTDATEGEILNGTVTFVSPTATKNSKKDGEESKTASVSKTRATYRVDVTLDGNNEKLRLGMTAKMTFIVADKSNVLAVPTSDISTNDDGSKYVVVYKADGTTENVPVQVGISNEFYSEITESTLKEGAKIVEDSADGGDDAALGSMGADGGIYYE